MTGDPPDAAGTTPADLQRRVAALGTALTRLTAAADSGADTDLAPLGEAVAALCQAIGDLPPDERRRFVAPLEALVDRLDALRGAIARDPSPDAAEP